MRMRFVNDFCYGKFVPVGAPENASGPPPRPIFMLLTRLHPEIRRRIAAAPGVFAKKLWREDMRRWDEEVKPDSIAQEPQAPEHAHRRARRRGLPRATSRTSRPTWPR